MSVVITNARIVTEAAELDGSIHLRGERIAGVDDTASSLPGRHDFEGDYALPGMVDLHTDNIERHFFPRPHVSWPSAIDALFAHDLQLLGAGVTTVFDALSLGDYDAGGQRAALLRSAIEAISFAGRNKLLKAEHFLHFRCEVSDEALMALVEPHLEHPDLKLLSVMDHTPGQRQWRDLDIYRSYKRQKTGQVWSDGEFAGYMLRKLETQARIARDARHRIRDASMARGIPLASHDDTTREDVEQSHAEGASICEFPTTLDAAQRARELGMGIVMGAPNIVLRGSHSGNVSASLLAERGLLDILSSDYVPSGLLYSAFILARETMSLPRAVATVSAIPADRVGLTDRGRIGEGMRADILRVRLVEGVPIVREVWRNGRQLVGSPHCRPTGRRIFRKSR